MNRMILATIILLLFSHNAWPDCMSNEEKDWEAHDGPGFPWYGKTGIKATGKDIGRIPAAEFKAGWAKVSKISMKSLPAIGLKQIKAERKQDEYGEFLARGDANFELKIDLNHDGTPETIFTGAYQDKAGNTGGFIAAIDPAAKAGHRVLAVFVEAGRCNFSYLVAVKEGVEWWKCFECDMPQTLVWKKGAYKLEAPDQSGYEAPWEKAGVNKKKK